MADSGSSERITSVSFQLSTKPMTMPVMKAEMYVIASPNLTLMPASNLVAASARMDVNSWPLTVSCQPTSWRNIALR